GLWPLGDEVGHEVAGGALVEEPGAGGGARPAAVAPEGMGAAGDVSVRPGHVDLRFEAHLPEQILDAQGVRPHRIPGGEHGHELMDGVGSQPRHTPSTTKEAGGNSSSSSRARSALTALHASLVASHAGPEPLTGSRWSVRGPSCTSTDEKP